MVHIFMGEIGAGKSYCGAQFANEHAFPFLEGDDFVPPEMAKKINLIIPPPEAVVANFVRHNLVQAIIGFAKSNPSARAVVVSQALYRNKHRGILTSALTKAGFEVEFYWVKCGLLQHARQLFSRPKGLGWLWFWLINKPFFQPPTHPHSLLMNTATLK